LSPSSEKLVSSLCFQSQLVPLQHGKVKLVLQRNKFFLESPFPSVLRELLADDVVRRARVGLSLPRGVSDWLHGTYWLSLICVLTAN
jgi:hypothetical protein